ncbi:hypothetical protein Dda3937_04469 [Dickeya dadantii 3937]|uniref:Uncharacterized protein n=1 Tax=Dickeya dadantii (strain 3937) TaxID=198628 RepID=E0SMK2_DICD3|nr:hypothetical protein Dda3937_04469 [Dickeya dadantii 3937]
MLKAIAAKELLLSGTISPDAHYMCRRAAGKPDVQSITLYTRHTSSCRCVGFITQPIPGPRPFGAAASCVQLCSRQSCHSPQSLTYVSSWGFAASPRYKTHYESCPEGPTLCIVQNATRFVLQLELFWV